MQALNIQLNMNLIPFIARDNKLELELSNLIY